MRGKSKSRNGGLETVKVEKLKEPQLSGAYIRNLVKQLTSSKTKDLINSKEHDSSEGEGISSERNLAGDICDHKEEKSQQSPQQPKKQVRRRLHTTRPYQERLLNMAEARREIVTALKFHRAAMKQASEKQQLQQQQQQQLASGYEVQPLESSSHQFSLENQFRRKPRFNASNSLPPNFCVNNSDNSPYSPNFVSPYSWHVSPIAPPPPPPRPPPPSFLLDNPNFPLPNQTLGLNLNLQDFQNLDTTSFYCNHNPSSIYSSSSPSTTSSPPISAMTEETPCFTGPPSGMEFGDTGLHPSMDDKEIAEIRSIGEQHQLEWDDTLNLMTSACWFNFLKAIENGPEDQKADHVNSPFDEVMEFPDWLIGNENCLEHLNDHFSGDFFQDSSLPRMDIEEIEGMDGEWLA